MLEDQLTGYLRRMMPAAEELKVIGLSRIAGGASRESYAFELEWNERGERRRRELILRRDPPGGLLQTSRDREFGAIAAAHRAGLKVPEPLFLETDPSVLGRPFFIMTRMSGRISSQVLGAFPASEPAALQERIAEDFLGELARLQAIDYRQAGLQWLGAAADPAKSSQAQTDEWRAVYERERMGESHPILSAAFAWLEAYPVRSHRIVVVHGDWRTGNMLYDDRGLTAMLDWEMCHLGDPMEDLGWASMRFWGWGEMAGGLLEREDFYRLYERLSGHSVDRERLFFYQMLGNVKMAVICLTGIRAFVEGISADATTPILKLLLAPLFDDLASQLRL
jgi:aminoglycoside phosphotransferase (APT) family kinase protein